MKLFSGLKKIRELERLQLPFLKSLIDFDIVIDTATCVQNHMLAHFGIRLHNSTGKHDASSLD